MSSPRPETVPQDWDEARDIPFFRVTAHLFSSAFCSGATVLLASNDDHRATAVARPYERRSSAARQRSRRAGGRCPGGLRRHRSDAR